MAINFKKDIIEERLKNVAQINNMQVGFMPKKSTVDAIYTYCSSLT